MMNLKLGSKVVAFVLAMAGGVTGCVSGNKTEAEAKPVAAVLPGVDNYPVPSDADFKVDLTLTNDAINTQLMAMQDLPKVTFTIWGYDELAADVSATSIKVASFDLRPQSVPYYLRFSDSDIQSIEYQSGSTDSLRYYITMGIDVDGDGQICNGDLRQNYAVSQPERFPVTQTKVVREIQVSEVSGEICSG